jgi:hypothetical protein
MVPANRRTTTLRQRVFSPLEAPSKSVNHPETAQLIASAEEATGYRINIDVMEGIQDDARMVAARHGNPFHLIRINSEQRRYFC